MKLAIIGSRKIENIENIDISQYISDDVQLIISGGAKGVDKLAEQYADKNRLSKYIIRPNYKRYGRGGAIIRNKEIVDFADEVLAFWDGKSNGTKNTIDYANKIEKNIKIVII